jgi:hypothetical protein
MIGWIKIHRSLTEHWIYNEKRKFSKLEAWIDLLITANYEDKKVLIKGKLYEVKRGESVLSLDSWSKRWNWDKSSVRRFFDLLQKDSMIELISDNITTHITICKYDSYQGIENANETQKNCKRNTKEFQTTPTKESKEDKESKEINNTPTFEEFFNFLTEKYIELNLVAENYRYGWKLKFDSWEANNWIDGNGKQIKNWKSKALNTLKYIEPKKEKPTYYEMPL